MTYDWDGTRTRRIQKLKLCLAVSVPIFIIGLGSLKLAISVILNCRAPVTERIVPRLSDVARNKRVIAFIATRSPRKLQQ